MASQRSLPVREHDTISAPGRQCTLLTGSLLTQQGRYKNRKGWPSPGAYEKAKIPSFATVLAATSSKSNGHLWFWRRWGDDDHKPMWRCVLSCIWSAFCCVKLVRARRNGGEISHFRRAETTYFHRPNICAPKISKTIQRLNWCKSGVLRNSFVRNSWYKVI